MFLFNMKTPLSFGDISNNPTSKRSLQHNSIALKWLIRANHQAGLDIRLRIALAHQIPKVYHSLSFVPITCFSSWANTSIWKQTLVERSCSIFVKIKKK